MRRVLFIFAPLLAAMTVVLGLTTVSGADTAPPGCRAKTAGARLLAGNDILANTASHTIRTEVGNLGEIPVTNIRFARPSTAYQLKGGTAGAVVDPREPAYFTTGVVRPEVVEFVGVLPPGTRGRFNLQVSTGTAAADVLGTWTVMISTDGGATFCIVPPLDGKFWLLNGNLRVLEFGEPVLPDPLVGDGTATSGQAVEVHVPVTNHATAAHTLSEYWATGDIAGTLADPGTLRAPLALGAGESGTFIVDDFTFGNAADNARYRLYAGTADASAQGGQNLWIDVEEPATFAADNGTLLSRSFQCDKTVANGGEPLTCSIVVDKTAGTAATLDEGTRLVLKDDDGDTYDAALAAPVSVPAGKSDNIRLQFATTTVPATFDDGVYSPTVHLSGTDANGAAVSGDLTYTATIVADAAPQIVSARTGRQTGLNYIELRMSEPVIGTHNVNNWTVKDEAGNQIVLQTVTGSGTSIWRLWVPATYPFPSNDTLTVTYTPGDLHDSADTLLPATTIQASDGIL